MCVAVTGARTITLRMNVQQKPEKASTAFASDLICGEGLHPKVSLSISVSYVMTFLNYIVTSFTCNRDVLGWAVDHIITTGESQ